jgi:mevalonate kinase
MDPLHTDAMTERTYHSKIILFGEYSMIFDATALMIPLRKFSAQWRFSSRLMAQGAAASNASLQRFADYLSVLDEAKAVLDLERFNHELYYELYLDSDVPSGYGLGSSGVLVAAVYDRYARQKSEDLLQLKTLFGKMESFFHGSSSGIDPLQCYLGKPFRISAEGVALLPEDFIPSDIHVFLADTGIKSNTKPLVQYFKNKREDPSYLVGFQTHYVPCVTACIEQLIKGEKEAFFGALRQLTDGQLKFLRPMITDNSIDLFLEKPDFNLGFKISGSGGGGYVLGFTDNIEKTKTFMEGYELIWIS